MIKYITNDNLGTFNLFTGKEYNFNRNMVSLEDRISMLKEIEDEVGYSFENYVSPIQEHTNVVKCVTLDNLKDEFKGVDGLITNLTNTALLTRVADCQAILLYDPVNKVIGNIHSGWKGTLNKIIVNAINIMISNYDCIPSNIKVCIYPSILKCCFEVDKDVVDMFNSNFDDIDEYITYDSNKNKYFIDTIEINKNEMIKLGINKDNIFVSDICTKCHSDEYHSYRADRDKSGRNLAIICMK